MKKINKSEKIESLRIETPNRNIEKLTEEINYILKNNRLREEEYKEKDRILREAIANMSHDLRTPLTSIMGYVYLLNDNSIGDNERREYLGIIEKRAEVLNGLITNFYGLSRVQADQYEINLEPVRLGYMLGDIVASFYETLESSFGEPKIEISEGLEKVIGDKQAINRIFINLTENMIKHGEGDVRISLKKEKNKIITEFSNKASLLEEKDIKRIFEKFFTRDRMRTGQNTGLGLAIVKLLVEKQGNEIQAFKRGEDLVIKILWNIEVDK
ncbi:sensor histidine kinase [Clostridium sp. B9]|uniref:sensor histidine kinase n=1 Tax=Clostridium sp. B9 TaxID=3423224 RepID=UPI003D2EC52D